MSKITEKLKDLFYDNTDYIIIVLIVITVSATIVWRLDSLFNKNDNKDLISNKEKTEDVIEEKPKPDASDELIEKEKSKQKGKIIVEIPEGSLPDVIANILLEKEVITDKFEFLKKSQEMGYDSKFKSGKYEFDKDESVEDVIRKITKQ